MAPARKQIKSFQNICEGSRIPSTTQQKMLHEDAEEAEFGYPKTRCLSSYYSIFVARLAIMVMLAILIGMLTMLTWHFTRTYTTNSINSLAYGLRYELLQRPILRMWNILNSTVEVTVAQVKLSEYIIGSYERPEEHGQQTELYEAMRDITWALFASKRALNAITISYTNGFVQAFHRDHRSNNTYYMYSDLEVPKGQSNHVQVPGSRGSTNMSAIWYRLPLDPTTGKKIGTRSQIPPDDLIKIAGLSEVRDGTASWHVAVSKFSDSPLLSAALPVQHPSRGNIVAVVGVTTAMKSVGVLMRELVEFHSGYMYLTSKEGNLLATSTDAPLLRNTTNGLKLMMANDSQDSMIRSGAEWLWRTYGDRFPINHEVHAENVILGQHKYYIDSFFLNLKRLPLVGVIIIPRKYVMGQVDKIGFTTFIVLITASICILAIGCVCILILTSGISKAMKLKAELISHLDARRRAEASSNYKSQFLANMSHELRTPMAAVIGLLDILMIDDCLTNEQFATVTQIRKCSTALLRLLNNILDLSKVESGKLVLEEAEFNLGRELEGLLDMFSVQCMDSKVEMILDLCDSMPKIVQGDSARVVQIFTNLISNSIKFTSEGHIILRGWHESSDHPCQLEDHNSQKTLQDVLKTKGKKECTVKRDSKKEDKITIWFEVEDTGCGIDPSKWEAVFESFEQADPSTTRTHGGTGLGLCIVRNLVNKMGGEIQVVKKEGPGTLMQLYLVLGMAKDRQQIEKNLGKCSFTVLLALNGSKGRSIMTQWLRENRVSAWEASDWNGFTQILHQAFQGNTLVKNSYVELSVKEQLELKRKSKVTKEIDFEHKRTSEVVIIVDTGLLDQSTNIWNEQLIFLDQYRGQAKFVWVLSHDTSNAIKVELRRRGNLLMVNKPLYKTKLIQILEAVASEENYEDKKGRASETSMMPSDYSECHVMDPIQFDSISSEDSGTSDTENSDSKPSTFPHSWKSDSRNSQENIPQKLNNMLVAEVKCNFSDINHSVRDGLNETTKENAAEMQTQNCLLKYKGDFSELKQKEDFRINKSKEANQNHIKNESCDSKEWELQLMENKNPTAAALCRGLEINRYKDTCLDMNKVDCLTPKQMVPHQNHLEGLYILLAEDNPILQRVATTMLEKLGAKVVAVGDGIQAVDALKCMFSGEKNAREDIQVDIAVTNQTPKPFSENIPIDLVLMDCQMPKMDGYEATKAIRELEVGSHMHIPIVALTAHAMSSDEAKCLEVGMDAYLTKPIDCKLMVSTILSLIQRNS